MSNSRIVEIQLCRECKGDAQIQCCVCKENFCIDHARSLSIADNTKYRAAGNHIQVTKFYENNRHPVTIRRNFFCDEDAKLVLEIMETHFGFEQFGYNSQHWG